MCKAILRSSCRGYAIDKSTCGIYKRIIWRSSGKLRSHFSSISHVARKLSGGGMERIKDEARHIPEELYMQSTLIEIERIEENIMGITQGLRMQSDVIERLSEKSCDLVHLLNHFQNQLRRAHGVV